MQSDEDKGRGDGVRDDRDGEPTVVRLQRRRDSAPDASGYETLPGSRPGTPTYRRQRPRDEKLRRVGEAEYEATPVALRPATALGRFWARGRAVLIGPPLASSQLSHERLSKIKALAIFSSDNLSSSAYATEEILLVLILVGSTALGHAVPIALAIAALAAIVATSYRQTIRAYPNGGGAYVVAKENLGVLPSLVAGSSLFVDYVLTVAVSTAAGVAAVTSAVPELHSARIEIAVGFVALLTIGNLRGIRESGTIFAIPTYYFIFSFGAMLGVGFIRWFVLGDDLTAAEPPHIIEGGTHTLTLFLVLRAFSSGCAALTGIEAIANGVPYFKPTEWKNAQVTLVWMAAILAAFFVGTTILAHQMHIVPSESQTVVAQINRVVFGHSPLFYAVQVATAMILVLAANTSFAGLPAAASVMASEGVMPKQFAFRGDRLAFSNGILVVGLGATFLLVAFKAETHRLIPLYAVGVFTAFTLSQAGMVIHWRRERSPGWKTAQIVNGLGAIATGIVAVIILATKFTEGAWLSVSIMALIVLFMWRIRSHYQTATRQLGAGLSEEGAVREYYAGAGKRVTPTVLVPVEGIDNAVLRTIAYARSISPNTTAIHVTDNREAAEGLRRSWEMSLPDVPLVVVESPYRSLLEPIVAYLDGIQRSQPNATVTVVLPEFITHRPWQQFLHNQLAARLKKALIARKNTVIVDVPYHLAQ